jgi:triosephosphate isomerase (TIM)
MAANKWLIGNWKMVGSLATNEALLAALTTGQRSASVGMGVCPAAVYLPQAHTALKGSGIQLGAQDISAHPQGAQTGQIAADMLAEFGVGLALVGHSERRQGLGESDAQVAAKTKAALAAGIVPVVCVGETLAEREAGQAEAVVSRQLSAVLAVASDTRLIVAYEPVWAIGTGKTASPEQAQDMHAAIRQQLTAAGLASVSILYGGSVKPGNAASLFAKPDIDGGLIGGASLVAADFLAIYQALVA